MESAPLESAPDDESTDLFGRALALFQNGNDRLAHHAARSLLERLPDHVGAMMLLLATAGGCGDEVTISAALLTISEKYGRLVELPEVQDLLESDLLAPVSSSQAFRSVFAPSLRRLQRETGDSADGTMGRCLQEAVRDASVDSVLLGAPVRRPPLGKSDGENLYLVDMAAGEALAALRSDRVYLVGRDLESDIRVGHPSVSRQHFQLKHREGFWLVRNLSRTNGTKLNGKRLDDHWVPLQEGDELQVGEIVLDLLAAGTVEDAVAPPPVAGPREIDPCDRTQRLPEANPKDTPPPLPKGTDRMDPKSITSPALALERAR